jgi:hypothetical protein
MLLEYHMKYENLCGAYSKKRGRYEKSTHRTKSNRLKTSTNMKTLLCKSKYERKDYIKMDLNESSVSVKFRKFLKHMNDYKLLKDSIPLSQIDFQHFFRFHVISHFSIPPLIEKCLT